MKYTLNRREILTNHTTKSDIYDNFYFFFIHIKERNLKQRKIIIGVEIYKNIGILLFSLFTGLISTLRLMYSRTVINAKILFMMIMGEQ